MATAPKRNQLPADRRVDEESYLDVRTPLLGTDADESIEVGPLEDILEELPNGDVMAPTFDDADITIVAVVDNEFYANLAANLPQHVRQQIASDLITKIEADKEARKKRDEQYAEGIRRTGLGNDAPGGAQFEGASRVVHPMMIKAAIDYQSRIMKELWPPSGPVKPKIIGAVTTEKAQQAQRVTEHMNFQLTSEMREARSVTEVTLSQVPLGGSQFIRLWYDADLKRPRCEFRSIDKMYVPYNAADFYSAQRKTYADTISAMEFSRRIERGMYRSDAEVPSSGDFPDISKSQQASDKVEGVDISGDNVDNDRLIYETATYLEATPELLDILSETGPEQEGGFYPYVVSIDQQNGDILSIYRNWEENDETFVPIEHDFEIPFLPWDGAFGIGLPHIIGGLSAAATGSLRALLDSAHIQNSSGGLIAKGSGISGQTLNAEIGVFTEVEVSLETKSIRDVIMPFQPTTPSPVLFQLLGFLTEAAEGVVRTSMDTGPTDTNTPVGTTMARLEEGLVVFSAIHARAHAAFNRLLAGLHRLNRLYLPEIVKIDAEGKELIVRRRDYEGPCVVQGVSDPTIYSDQQRFAQLNYIQNRTTVFPQLWKLREVELAGLRLMRWPDPELLLQDQPEPQELNPTNESLSMSLGQPVMVFPEQDHMAHLQVHLDYTKSPLFGMNPLIAPRYLPLALQHIAEHIAYLYVEKTVETVKQASGTEPTELMGKDPEVKRRFDALLAQSSGIVIPQLEQMMAQAQPVLQAAQQQLQAMMPKPPMDPAQAAIQVATMETQRKTQADQTNAQLTAAKEQTAAQTKQQTNAIAAQRNQITQEGQRLAAETKAHDTAVDAATALQVAEHNSNTALEVAGMQARARDNQSKSSSTSE